MAAKKPKHAKSRGITYTYEGEAILFLKVDPQVVRYEPAPTPEQVAAMAADMVRNGQLSPAIGRKHADGTVSIVDGRKRYAAACAIHADPGAYGAPGPIPFEVTIKDCDDEGAIILSWKGNTGEPPGTMDIYSTAVRLEKFGWSHARIAEELTMPYKSLTEGRINQILSLKPLPKKLKDKIHKSAQENSEIRFNESNARVLLSMELSDKDMMDYADRIDSGDLSSADLKAEADKKKRAAGKTIKRSITALKTKLKSIGTEDAWQVVMYLEGYPTVKLEDVFPGPKVEPPDELRRTPRGKRERPPATKKTTPKTKKAPTTAKQPKKKAPTTAKQPKKKATKKKSTAVEPPAETPAADDINQLSSEAFEKLFIDGNDDDRELCQKFRHFIDDDSDLMKDIRELASQDDIWSTQVAAVEAAMTVDDKRQSLAEFIGSLEHEFGDGVFEGLVNNGGDEEE